MSREIIAENETIELRKRLSKMSMSVVLNWKKIYRILLFWSLVTKTYRKLSEKLVQNVKEAPVLENRSLAYLLKSYGNQPSMEFIKKVKDILVDHRDHRSPKNLEILDKLLSSKIQDFAKLSQPERLHLCKIMKLDFYPQVLRVPNSRGQCCYGKNTW
jgi:hypothetical protein